MKKILLLFCLLLITLLCYPQGTNNPKGITIGNKKSSTILKIDSIAIKNGQAVIYSGSDTISMYVAETSKVNISTIVPLLSDSNLYKSGGFITPDFYFNNTKRNNKIRTAQLLGSDIKTCPITSFVLLGGNTYTLADGSAFEIILEPVEQPTVVTGVRFVLQTAGNFTADNYNGVALYTVNTTTQIATKVDSTANDGNLWKATASTKVTKAFVNTYTLQPNTVYALRFVYNSSAQTTAPVIYGENSQSGNSQFLMDNGIKFQGILTGQAYLSTTFAFADLTTSGYCPFIWLY